MDLISTPRPSLTKMSSRQPDVHDQIVPAEIRPGDPVRIKILSPKLSENTPQEEKYCQAWSLSPLGVEIIQTTTSPTYQIGRSVDMLIQVGAQKVKASGRVVAIQNGIKNSAIVGIRFTKKLPPKDHAQDQVGRRWATSEVYVPTGFFPNPGVFNDSVYFTVAELSRGGAKLYTSLRNNYLVVGMTLAAQIHLPLVGSKLVKLKIENIKVDSTRGNRDGLQIGVSFVHPPQGFVTQVAQYLLQFGLADSVRDIRNEGFHMPSSASSIDFRYVRSDEEYLQVLELRKIAYGGVGKITSERDLSDQFDSRARIIIGTYRGKVVATCRLIYNEEADSMEHEAFVSFDKGFPKKSEICEITRVCTHPDFRGSDILLSLFQFAARTVIQSGRRYTLGSATEQLLPLYTRLGFRRTKYHYNHKTLNNTPHVVFLADIQKVAIGSGVNPIIWNIAWRNLVQYAKDFQMLHLGPMANLRIGFYRLFYPLALVAKHISTRPRKRPTDKRFVLRPS